MTCKCEKSGAEFLPTSRERKIKMIISQKDNSLLAKSEAMFQLSIIKVSNSFPAEIGIADQFLYFASGYSSSTPISV